MFLHDHIQAGPHPLTRTDTEAAAHWAAAEQGAGSRRSLPTPLRGPGLGDTPVFLEETPAVCKNTDVMCGQPIISPEEQDSPQTPEVHTQVNYRLPQVS